MKGPGIKSSISANHVGRVGILVSRWNETITKRLLDGALDGLEKTDVPREAIEVLAVPGSFELPQAAEELARTGQYDAIVALGCLIEGETIHYEIIAQSVAQGLDEVARKYGIPVSFGVLTVGCVEQALARSGGRLGNKGEDAAIAAMEMTVFKRELSQNAKPHPST